MANPSYIQKPFRSCPRCYKRAPVKATDSVFEFTFTCPACGEEGIISWDHANPVPSYEAPRQPGLDFDNPPEG